MEGKKGISEDWLSLWMGLFIFVLGLGMFIGETSSTGVWQERGQGCGDCVLGITGGLCPVTRCAKGLLNGPCGGSQGGKCEVSATLKCDVPCVWAMIYERLGQLGELDRLLTYQPPKDWRPGGFTGPRQLRRENV